ncbi:MAG: DUF1223 domain-containing protein [Bacteroidetes bacterium]|nr:DUF1223 domain-containing protein [Bacteroidota bacterium]
MKFSYCIIVIALNFCLLSCEGQAAGNAVQGNQTDNEVKGFAVVELFTSEGCSSCPPADKAVAELLKQHTNNVYVLEYHVDYWNDLGWKDPFSNAAYLSIQKKYAQHFKLASLYIPQVVVNGSEQFVGSDVKKLNNVVNKCLQQTTSKNVNIKANRNNDKIIIQYTTNVAGVVIRFALVQLQAVDKISNGENSGATLHHVNIVRDIENIQAFKSGNVAIKLPANFTDANFKVIAFVQDVNDDKIIAATATDIN